jgi:hypothetical protein
MVRDLWNPLYVSELQMLNMLQGCGAQIIGHSV